ncbi:hypothetical protein [Thiosocius teredinicola]|uniref:hypothetical protein n=1 Tax=Thiosocius teredinicola TaxID=1973002 RepID=UPI0013DD9910
MKRELSMTQLHMGCGEGLTGRIRLKVSRRLVFTGAGVSTKHASSKVGKGKR